MELIYNGFVYTIEVTHWCAGSPPILRADPNDCYEGDPVELEFYVENIRAISERSSYSDLLCEDDLAALVEDALRDDSDY